MPRDEKEQLASALPKLYAESGFGSPSKRELDLLIFHHLRQAKGHFAEYTFNAEVLRIAPIRLFELIIENMEHAEVQFNELVRTHIDDHSASDRIIEGAHTLKQKFARLRKETMTARTLGSLLGDAASAFGAYHSSRRLSARLNSNVSRLP